MLAAAFFDNSLAFCSQKHYYSREEILQLMQKNCPTIHSRIRYALAKELGRYLGEQYATVQSVYVYGSTMKDSAGKTSDIDLLVLVGEKTPSLAQAVQLLNDKLLSLYRVLLGDDAPPIRRMLDVHIVDTDEVAARRGYGTLIGSLYQPPTKIWSRNSDLN
ncbi:nucleotidyltransferase domain-containing protein [Desulfoscipio geothermicus]|uniref:Nucleotidyltransferase domain-containing protein n=1 Tax=Desulfoscipio geothermicus DSM 3669 TaxID=1121426 RepID=A0A1I6DPQ0_9FIRM|nr:nucleotidyltransferase domain-containing protein [Desulfoscipio geothermicus]SFR07338.1 Nucleotidyltransferase domain-containing protein [Desulfoscipio geothermicus DSM 3669]